MEDGGLRVLARAICRRLATTPSRGSIGVLIAGVCLIVYARTLANGFVNFDDGRFITNNPVVQRGLTGAGVMWAFTTDQEIYFIPMAWLSHMLDCQVFGLHAWGHHLTSAIIHTINALLVFWVLARMTGRLWPAALTALLFAVHPLHVESVVWISERKDVLSAFFGLLAMGAYFRYAQRPGLARYLAVAGLFALGLMAKPMIMTLPAILLLLDYWPLKRISGLGFRVSGLRFPLSHPQTRSWFALLLEKVPLFALSIADCAYSLITVERGVSLASMEQRPLTMRLSCAIVSYARYLVKVVWPSDLVPFYPIPEGYPPLWQTAGALILLTAISVAAVAGWKRRPYLLVGWAWYLAMLSPVVGLVQPAVGFNPSDRYTYLPLIGIFIMVAWALRDLDAVWRGRNLNFALRGTSLAALTAFSVLSVIQIGYWRDGVTLFTHALRATGDTPVAHNNLGQALADLGRHEEALAHYEKAVAESEKSYPNPTVHCNLASAYTDLGRYDDAIAQYTRALEIDPGNAQAHNNLGVLLAKRGDAARALAHYEEAVRLDPRYASARINLATALVKGGRMPEAIIHFGEAVRLDPGDFKTHYNLATALAATGQLDEAVAEYQRTLDLEPGHVDACINLGVAKAIQKKYDEALVYYEEALERDPGNAKALKDIAEIRSAKGSVQ